MKNKKVWDQIKNNDVFVSGAFFLAAPDIIRKFTRDYRDTVKEMINKNVASTDQQFISALYSKQLNTKPSVPLRQVTCGNPH